MATLAEREGRYLLIEEHTPEGLRLNNPAGHLEPGESLVQAATRETLEETAHPFTPEALVGVYLARFERAGTPVTYLRVAIAGQVGEAIAGRALDSGIVRVCWLTPDEVRASAGRHRSPLVLQCIEDHLAGQRLPLDVLHTHASVFGA